MLRNIIIYLCMQPRRSHPLCLGRLRAPAARDRDPRNEQNDRQRYRQQPTPFKRLRFPSHRAPLVQCGFSTPLSTYAECRRPLNVVDTLMIDARKPAVAKQGSCAGSGRSRRLTKAMPPSPCYPLPWQAGGTTPITRTPYQRVSTRARSSVTRRNTSIRAPVNSACDIEQQRVTFE